jgi:ribosome assembly protein YihI (activator of Der GTPase)
MLFIQGGRKRNTREVETAALVKFRGIINRELKRRERKTNKKRKSGHDSGSLANSS